MEPRKRNPTVEETDNYDPYENRQPKRPLSNFEAFILLTKGIVGVGLLSSPLIYKKGYLTGILYTCIIGFLITYCLQILFRSQYRLCRRLKVPVLSYSESMKKALQFGPPRLRVLHRYAPFIVDSSTLLGQFALCTSYAVFILQTFGFLEIYTAWWSFGFERYMYCLILIIPFVVIFYIGNWKIAVYVSIVATLAYVASIAIVFSYVLKDLPLLRNRKMIGDINQFPNFFGPVLFSLQGVSVLSTFEKHLKSPKQFVSSWGTMNIGMILMTILYILVGFLSFWKYGERSIGDVLNDLPLEDTPSIWCRCLYTFAIYLSYGLHGFVLVDIFWMKTARGFDITFKHFFRIAFVVGSTLIIIFVPFIIRTVIVDALYALSLPILGIVLPALMEFCIEWPTHHNNRSFVLWKDTFLIVLGLADTFVGLYFGVTQLIQFFSIHKNVIFW
ncbi:proton-coupled amino acid transporter-like protein CG1139 isoform X2 [Harmonia axyridis]|uniref:proton-coupled amino acid transporter-like protein CG1139 isoform X2 n=1 Tax=Harmonia axyridis TaxID=115357 RepID=UPI001E278F00|nr:proton-coupled amino acid transporter-like protein CG1139 isoform X2 [Harmonia axyridis]